MIVNISCISEPVKTVWNTSVVLCAMFVDRHALPPNDPEELCGRICYPFVIAPGKILLASSQSGEQNYFIY